jgi:hypothetical protein
MAVALLHRSPFPPKKNKKKHFPFLFLAFTNKMGYALSLNIEPSLSLVYFCGDSYSYPFHPQRLKD